MANPRPYLRSARKIEWDSTFGKILGGPERKTKFSETRRKQGEPEGSALWARRAGTSTNLIRPMPWPIGQGKPRGYFGNFRVFLIYFWELFLS